MTKQISTKHIKAQIINELSKEYKAKYEDKITQLQDLLHEANIKVRNCQTDLLQLKNENDELSQKVHQYQDWIIRLQDFMDMPEDVRQVEIENYKKRLQGEFTVDQRLSSLIKMMSSIYMP